MQWGRENVLTYLESNARRLVLSLVCFSVIVAFTLCMRMCVVANYFCSI
jgi:hypothetical protein